MLISYKHSQTSIILRVKILDSAATTGAGKTGLTSASSGLIISTIASNEETATAYTVAAGNIETITTLGTFAAPTSGKCRFKEVDATNHKGVYEIHLADARYAVGSARHLLISISGASGAAECDALIPLVQLDPYEAMRGTDGVPTNPMLDTEDGSSFTAIPDMATATSVNAIKAKTDQLIFTIPNQIDANALSGAGGLDASGIRAAIGLDEANLDIQLEVLPTLNELNSRTRGAF